MSVSSAPADAALEGDAALLAAAAALRSARATRTRRRLGVVAVVLAAAIGFLLYKALTSGVVYFKTVAEAVAARASLGNSTFQIEGVVVPHSLQVSGVHQRFALCSGPVHIPVHNVGTPPQLFTSGVAVVLVGHFVGASNLFSSDQILVKHSSSYVAAHPGRVQHGDNQHC
ncbi:MAG: cytochrome c maturation protein CcmE [Actinomycetota bacterium]|nr:cytochrome c maturation protein CcmE [Actinomycetota bacterium]